MITFKPFKTVYPNPNLAHEVAALPYDVFNRNEAQLEVLNKEFSFLRIDRAETNFDDSIDMYADIVYQKAASLLSDWIDSKILVQDELESYYIYELSTPSHSQTGLVGLTSVNDLINGSIKDHEKTRDDKRIDRIKHIDACNAHTGPILMFYQDKLNFSKLLESIKRSIIPMIDIVSDDHIHHRVFKVTQTNHQIWIINHFNNLNTLYIADGHHRASAAKAIAIKRNKHNVSDSTLSSNLFLSVVFPSAQLKILDYNRVIKDLNGLTPTMFLELIQKDFEIHRVSTDCIHPTIKGQFSMCLEHKWYLISYKNYKTTLRSAIEMLDVSILQTYILAPILGITNPATDSRLDFVGGIRGLAALEDRLNDDCVLAFALVATSIEELIQISDLGLLMPPKSTWFEPKLRSGLFIHLIDK